MYARALLLSSCTAVWLMGCRTTSGPPATPLPRLEPAGPTAAAPPPDKPIDLALRVEALTKAGRSFFLDSEDALRSGDRLALYVSLSEPAYVYVGLTSSDGTQSVIFPRSGSQELLAAAVDHRIPRAGWFKLDQQTGQEHVFVYASRRPLSAEEALALVKQDSAGRVAPEPEPPTEQAAAVAREDAASSRPAPEGRISSTPPRDEEEAVASAKDGGPATQVTPEPGPRSKRATTKERKSTVAQENGAKPRATPEPAQAGPAWTASAASPPLAYAPGPLTQNDRGLQLVSNGGVDVEADVHLTKAHFLIRHTR